MTDVTYTKEFTFDQLIILSVGIFLAIDKVTDLNDAHRDEDIMLLQGMYEHSCKGTPLNQAMDILSVLQSSGIKAEHLAAIKQAFEAKS